MRLYRVLILIIGMSVWHFSATAINSHDDPYEIRFIKESKDYPNHQYQGLLRQGNAWNKFSQDHKNWYVIFDENSGMPHRASGKPFQTKGGNPREAANDFIETILPDFIEGKTDLKFQTENFSGKYYNVFFTQQYKGLDIIGSRLFVKLTPEFGVSTFGMDLHQIESIPAIPSIDIAQVSSLATADFGIRILKVSDAVLKILPLPVSGKYEYHLVYELNVFTEDENKIPGNYYSLIDAVNGKVLYRQNKVHFSHPMNTDVNVSGTVSMFNPFQPGVTVPLPNLYVNDGFSTLYTDSLGDASLSGSVSSNADFRLSGLWSTIYTDGGSVTPSISAVFNPGQAFLSFDSVTTIQHISGYYHVNIVHDFMKQFFPAFPTLDFSLPTQIDLTSGSCNAFYSGSDINFYAAGGGCNSMAKIGDVVYHEYGHGINDMFYQWQGGSWNNGGMGEGYADVWALSITQNPVLGNGYRTSSSTSFIRRYDTNRKVYPQNLTGEVHDDGEIIAGAWYDVSLNLGSWNAMTTLFASTYYDLVTGFDGTEGQVYADILLSALNHDDNDGDLSNGTPNDSAILAAFDLHGITLLNSVEITHNEILAAASSTTITVDASMAAQFPWYTINVKLNYKVDSGSWNQIPMVASGTGTYTANIPGQIPGSLISYYIESIDGSGNSLSTNPVSLTGTSLNIPYFIPVGFDQIAIEDFDAHQSSGWLTGIPADNATSGFWIIDSPVPSYTSSGELCQTDQQHTPGGIQCAVTGNAVSSTSSVGYNDVDGGKTTLQSPMFDISEYSIPLISYWRWYTNDQGSAPGTDYWRTYISEDGTTFIPVENLKVPDHRWRRYALKVHDILPGATSVMLRFVADDAGNGSIVEGALDDIELMDVLNGVSVNEVRKDLSMRLYPNPAASVLYISFNSDGQSKGKIELINTLGQVIFSDLSNWNNGENHRSIDTGNLSSGIYRIVLSNEKTSVVKGLTILHD